MIALPSIAFGGFSGSAKDVTARQRDGRSILTVRCWPTGQATNAQVVRRASLSKITKSYKNLSDSQMQEWERLAKQTNGVSVFGQKAELSGINLYVRLNANRSYCGEIQPLVNPPQTIVSLPSVRYDSIFISEEQVFALGVADPDGDYRLVVKMSQGQSRGVSSAWGKAVIIAPDCVPDWGDVDLTQSFISVLGHSPVNGEKYFIEMYWIDPATGFTGVPVKVSVFCEAGVAPVSRVAYQTSDIVNDSSRFITSLDMEFAPGSTILTTELEFDSTNHDTREAMCKLKPGVAQRTPNYKSFALARSLPEDNYIPAGSVINKYKWGNEYELHAGWNGGEWKRKGIVFGTCPLFKL